MLLCSRARQRAAALVLALFVLAPAALYAQGPSISNIPTQTVNEDGSLSIPFTVDDPDTPLDQLVVSATSSDQALVPDGNLSLSGAGNGRTLSLTPLPDQNGAAVVTVTVSDGTTSAADTFDLTVTPVNDPPTISTIPDISIAEDTPSSALAFTIGDVETAATLLTVGATSSDEGVVPSAGLTLGGSGTSRTITVAPAPNASGVATVTVMVQDGNGGQVSTSFQVTVTPVNDPPTIAPIANTSTAEDTSIDVPLTVADADTPAAQLQLTATSGDQTVVPDSQLHVIGPPTAPVLRIQPAPNQTGATSITVTVADGAGGQASTSFTLTVSPVNDPPTISNIADVTIGEDGTTGAIAFTVADPDTNPTLLQVTASSSNTTLVPAAPANIAIGGSGTARTIQITPALDQHGATTITVTVQDDTGLLASATFIVTVTPVDDPPTISALGAQVTDEDVPTAPQAFTISDVDTALGSLTLSASSSNTTLAPVSRIALGGSGANRTVSVSPATDQSGTATISVTVSDGTSSASSSFGLTVNAVNDAPVISAIATQSTNEDTPTGSIGFTIGDAEDPPAALTVAATSSNTALVPNAPGAIVLSGAGANRTIQVVPAPDAFGTTTIIVTVTDTLGNQTMTSFVLDVTSVNDPPTIVDVPDEVTAEDVPTAARSFTVADIDSPPASLTVTATSSNTTLVPTANIVLSGSGTNWSVQVTPAPDQSGTATIVLTVRDGSGAAASDPFLLTVTAVNDPPTIAPVATQTTNEDVALQVGLTVSDVDTAASQLVVSATSSDTAVVPASGLAVTGSGTSRTLTVTPAADQSGSSVITVTVSDGSSASTAQFTVNVTALPDAPTISAIPNQQTTEGTPTAPIPFTIRDADNPPTSPASGLTLSGTSSNQSVVPDQNIVFGGSGASRTVTLSPVPNTPGSTQITVIVSDGALSSASTFTLSINAVNDPPTISNIVDQTMAEDGSLGPVAFTVDDIDNAPASLTLSATSSNPALLPAGNVVFGGSGNSRTFQLTPLANQFGSAIITVSVSDGAATATDSFVLTVSAVDDPPTIAPVPNQQTNEDVALGPIAFTVNDIDTPPAQLTVSAHSSDPIVVPNSPANLTVGGSGTARTLTITPAPDQAGQVVVTLTVSDGMATASALFTLNVTPINDAPTVTAIAPQTTAEDTATPTLAFTIGDVETPATALTVTVSSSDTALVPTANLLLGGTGASRTLVVAPAPDKSGQTTVTITVGDGTTSTSTAFVVTVTAVNDAPTISPLAADTTSEDTPAAAQSFTLNDLDTPLGSLTLSAASTNTVLVPVGNIVFGGTGPSRTVTVTPAPDQSGVTTVTVTVSDGVATASSAFVFTVTAINDAPTIAGLSNTSTPEDTSAGPLAFTVADVDNAAAGLAVTATSSNQTIVPNANIALGGAAGSRTITLQPAANQSGSTTILVTVNDGAGGVASRSFVLTVTSVNDPPTVSAIADLTIGEDSQTGAIAFSVADLETPVGSLGVSASSSDTTLVPNATANLTLSGTGGARTLVVRPAANQAGTATITVTVSDGSAATATSFVLTVGAINDPPTISAIANQTTTEDRATGPVAFTVSDVDTSAAALSVTVTSSSDPLLVPLANVTLTGGGNSWTVDVAPAPDEPRGGSSIFGTSTIVLTVSDGAGGQAQRSFAVRVNAAPDTPTISQIPDQQTVQATPSVPTPFVIGDADNPFSNPAQGLTLSGSSSDQSLIRNGAIFFGGSGANRTVSVVPELGQSGSALIDVTVSDGTRATTERFAMTVTNVPCQYTLFPTALPFGASGGTSTVTMTPTPQSCAWTASSGVPWITISPPAQGVGNGGIGFTVAPNPTAATRTGTVDVGGQMLTVTQAGLSCTFTLLVVPAGTTVGSSSATFPVGGGGGSLSIATTPGCPWTLAVSDTWITIPMSGVAPTTQPQLVPFSVAPNGSGAPRSLTLSIGSQTVAIHQGGPVTVTDGDGDGLPDTWEAQFGLKPNSITFDDGPTGDPDHDGVLNIDEFRRGTHPRGFNTRYLAEGATGSFFQTLVAIANPETIEALVLLTFQRSDGTTGTQYLVVPPRSRRTIDVSNIAGFQSAAFATRIESDTRVVIDRRMTWDANGYGAHAETSLPQPQATWYLAEGATHSGFQLFYLLQNPDPTTSARVRVTYLLPAAGGQPQAPAVVECAVPPQSRKNIWVNFELCPGGVDWNNVPVPFDGRLQASDVSAKFEVVSGPPIVVERAMYLSNGSQFFAAGHAGAGIPQAAQNWYLAEGAADNLFNTFILLANPSATAATAEVKFLRQGAPPVYLQPNRQSALPTPTTITLAPNSRETVWLNLVPQLNNTSVSTVVAVTNGVDVLAERAMWWPGPGPWYEAHNSAGVTLPPGAAPVATRWALADGESGGSRSLETFVLVANTSATPARVRTTLLFEDGTTASREDTVPAAQRDTVWVRDGQRPFTDAQGQVVTLDGKRFGVVVESIADTSRGITTPAQIVVERAMYWNAAGQFWAAGTNAVGTRLQ